jgi:hypothetical protein
MLWKSAEENLICEMNYHPVSWAVAGGKVLMTGDVLQSLAMYSQYSLHSHKYWSFLLQLKSIDSSPLKIWIEFKFCGFVVSKFALLILTLKSLSPDKDLVLTFSWFSFNQWGNPETKAWIQVIVCIDYPA